ncbi:hypothetical protein [Clostridium perfringens]|uniref:hypothetical protein n=1 Tax=Clostridium perfringens TaxID=1502 RepID=UPI0013145EF7|nr:hypothetical protein [Clostridium perfringens]
MFDIIYNSCKTAGWAFGFGAFEGFIIYLGVITFGYLMVTGKNNGQSIKMAKEK